MAAAGVEMRTIQEWTGHRDFDLRRLPPSCDEAALVDRCSAEISNLPAGSRMSARPKG
jgi:hypothetical protein